MSVFIDTGAFLAYRNKKDKYHEIASKLFRDALNGKYGQMYASDYIYDEALTLALVRTKSISVAMDISEVILSPRIKMVFVDAALLGRATKTIKQYSGRNLSFTDAVSLEIMNEFDIEKYLGFDAHFNGIVGQV
ncbi:MAG: PIN domain-containing protein [Candidatus Methanoperedens sp.]|nr:PIN domain-containing protein [Candidatus Methanoperedens sp.]MCZ7394333.1 PIN domain-containing protein [Candidatus Methanoperedens sp.]